MTIPFRNTLSGALALTALAAAGTAQDWYREDPAVHPAGRRFHAQVYDAARAVTVVFGGRDERAGTTFGDTWEYDGVQWMNRATTGPTPRDRAAHCYDPTSGGMLLFGGRDAAGNALADTWVWDGRNWLASNSGVRPPARYGAQLAFDAAHERAVLFGGRDDAGNALGDTWLFGPDGWSELHPVQDPGARHGHAMTWDSADQRVLLLGGFEAGASRYSMDLWAFDGRDWQELVTATTPSSMVFPALTFFDAHGVAVLAGSVGSAGLPVETWAFDGADWQRVHRGPSDFFGRTGQGLSYDAAHEAVVMFGGATTTFGGALPRDETWELSTPAEVTVVGAGCDLGRGPVQLALGGVGRPHIGRALKLAAGPFGPNALPFVAVGTSDQQSGGVPLPIDLTPFGLPGCALRVAVDVTLPATLEASGQAWIALPLPRDPGLLGQQLFVQMLSAGTDGGASDALRLTLGN